MKTDSQILSLIETMSFKSQMDWDMIDAFCQSKLNLSIPAKFKPNDEGLDSVMFMQWYENGLGAGDVVVVNDPDSEFHECLAIVGKSNLNEAKLEGFIKGDEFVVRRLISPICLLIPATYSERKYFINLLSRQGLQLGFPNCITMAKKIPQINERVAFYNEEARGLGVVRSVDAESGVVELYCYYLYDTGKMGYSMHESDICTVHDFFFDAMSIPQQRRLNRELNKAGMLWNEKMHRVEPVEVKVAIGEKYWYINDKLKAVEEFEKGTPTSHFRYLAANYFKTQNECMEYAGRMAEILRDRLAGL